MQKSMFIQGMLPNVLQAGCKIFPTGSPYKLSLHNHPEWTEILLISEGYGSVEIEGDQYEIGPGSLVIYNQGVWHSECTDPNYPHAMFHIGFSNLQLLDLPYGHLSSNGKCPVIQISERNMEEIKRRMLELCEAKTSSLPESKAFLDYLFSVLLVNLVREIYYGDDLKDINRTTSVHAAVTVKRYIHEHYIENITIEKLSQIAYLSSFHLSRIFKQQTGLSPIQYLIHYRMDVSKQYLISTDKTVEMISKLVGYDDVTYFYALFKRKFGVAPGQFRKYYQKTLTE